MAIYISDSNGILKKVAGAGASSGDGGSIVVDQVLNSESTNPVQNKVLYAPVSFAERERQKSETEGAIIHRNHIEKELNEFSENTVTNKVVTKKFNEIAPSVSFAESERQKSKNLFDKDAFLYQHDINIGETGQTIVNGVSAIRIGQNALKLIAVKPNTMYIFSNPSNFKFALGQVTIDKKSLGDTGWLTNTPTYSFVTTSNTYYLGVIFGKDDDSTISQSDYDLFMQQGFQLEEGSVATEYQPYNGAIVHEKNVAGLKGNVLWENPNSSAEFSAQTINLNSGDYDYYEVYYKYYYVQDFVLSVKSIKGNGTVLQLVNVVSGNPQVAKRQCSFSNDTQLYFQNTELSTGGDSSLLNNTLLIPICVIGYKRS